MINQTMPREIVLVRHGESEANIVQRAEKDGIELDIPPEFYQRHDWEHRLSPLGVEQAKKAGAWILENLGDPATYFDRAYVSTYMRARETAAYIGGPACQWLVEERLRERDWGTYGATPTVERGALFPRTEQMRRQSYLYTRFDNGESVADVYMHARDMLGTWFRDTPDKKIIAVTHGDTIGAFRLLLEHMLPEEWELVDRDKKQSPRNCSLIHYSRVNPEDHEDVRDHILWRRMIRTDDETKSPFDGRWVELTGRRRFSSEELERLANAVPRIFPEATT